MTLPADIAPAPTLTPFDALGTHLAHAFGGTNVLLYGGALITTGTMSLSGADHAIRVSAQRYLYFRAFGDAAYYGGYIGPTLVALGTYAWGLASHSRELAGAGAAATQALVVAAGATGVLKWATGRPFPSHGEDPRNPDRLKHPEYAREFAFEPFTLQRGWAWPSGHTSTSVSVAAALSAYYADSPMVAVASYPIALGIGLGMVDGDHHWGSDVVAGALLGHAIGYSIGKDFREMYTRGHAAAGSFEIHFRPMSGATLGVVTFGYFE